MRMIDEKRREATQPPGLTQRRFRIDAAAESAPRMGRKKVPGRCCTNTLASRRGPVVEYVALVAAASSAVVLGEREEELVVGFCSGASFDGLGEARPAGAAIVFVPALEQWQVAGRAEVHARSLLVVQFAGESPLGIFVEQYLEATVLE